MVVVESATAVAVYECYFVLSVEFVILYFLLFFAELYLDELNLHPGQIAEDLSISDVEGTDLLLAVVYFVAVVHFAETVRSAVVVRLAVVVHSAAIVLAVVAVH